MPPLGIIIKKVRRWKEVREIFKKSRKIQSAIITDPKSSRRMSLRAMRTPRPASLDKPGKDPNSFWEGGD